MRTEYYYFQRLFFRLCAFKKSEECHTQNYDETRNQSYDYTAAIFWLHFCRLQMTFVILFMSVVNCHISLRHLKDLFYISIFWLLCWSCNKQVILKHLKYVFWWTENLVFRFGSSTNNMYDVKVKTLFITFNWETNIL